jgi:hypothetical protein
LLAKACMTLTMSSGVVRNELVATNIFEGQRLTYLGD